MNINSLSSEATDNALLFTVEEKGLKNKHFFTFSCKPHLCLFHLKLMSEKYYIFSAGNGGSRATILVNTLCLLNHTFHFSTLKFRPLPP